jgi:hypothetical protein
MISTFFDFGCFVKLQSGVFLIPWWQYFYNSRCPYKELYPVKLPGTEKHQY